MEPQQKQVDPQEVGSNGRRVGLGRDEVKGTMDAYAKTYESAEPDDRFAKYATTTKQYYNLVTDFYEYGWGQSFHFAVRHRNESMKQSIAEHQRFLAEKLGLSRGKKAIDLGCGVGGPMRTVARLTGADVTGGNITAYQVERAKKYNEREGLAGQCTVLESDFLKVPLPDGSFDAAYAFEATCHAPDKQSVFGEAARLLKPGGIFAVYEWCITPVYDHALSEHRRIRHGIEKGNALPSLATFDEVKKGLTDSGFDILDTRDRAAECDAEVPWYSALDEISVRNLPRTPAGRVVTSAMTRVLETLRVAPKGSTEVSNFLNECADSLVGGGKLGIFTPMYFALARKK